MSRRTLYKAAMAAFLLLTPIILTACNDPGSDQAPGLSREEVEEMVRAELTKVPATPRPDPGVTSAEAAETVQAAVQAASAGRPEPETL